MVASVVVHLHAGALCILIVEVVWCREFYLDFHGVLNDEKLGLQKVFDGIVIQYRLTFIVRYESEMNVSQSFFSTYGNEIFTIAVKGLIDDCFTCLPHSDGTGQGTGFKMFGGRIATFFVPSAALGGSALQTEKDTNNGQDKYFYIRFMHTIRLLKFNFQGMDYFLIHFSRSLFTSMWMFSIGSEVGFSAEALPITTAPSLRFSVVLE